jgi:hypothetical protein
MPALISETGMMGGTAWPKSRQQQKRAKTAGREKNIEKPKRKAAACKGIPRPCKTGYHAEGTEATERHMSQLQNLWFCRMEMMLSKKLKSGQKSQIRRTFCRGGLAYPSEAMDIERSTKLLSCTQPQQALAQTTVNQQVA